MKAPMKAWILAVGVMRVVGVVAGTACVVQLGGCAGYATFPAQEGSRGAMADPNGPPINSIMAEGLRWVAMRHPPPAREDGPAFAINLPEGVRARTYQWVAAQAGGVPLPEAGADLPVYHVKSVRVRGDEAKIEIVRPVLSLGQTPAGEPVYQDITLTLRGGVRPWHVTAVREWTPGFATAPAPNVPGRASASVPEGDGGGE